MATQLTATKRFIRPGITKVYFVATTANYEAMTKAELDAGTDLTPDIADTAGWDIAGSTVDTPDWGSLYISKVSGTVTSSDSSLTLYADETGDDVRTLLPRGTTGYVVWMDGGEVAAQPMDVFPVSVTSLTKERTQADPARLIVNFAITSEPSEDQPIPSV